MNASISIPNSDHKGGPDQKGSPQSALPSPHFLASPRFVGWGKTVAANHLPTAIQLRPSHNLAAIQVSVVFPCFLS